MRPATLALLFVAIAAAVAGLIWLERRPKSDAMRLSAAPSATIAGQSVPTPPDYLVVADSRVQLPPGAIAFAREGGGRATIVIAPYPGARDDLFSQAGCETALRLHAKQVGARLGAMDRETGRCRAELLEGSSIGGSATLVDGEPVLMVTCRHPRDSASDRDACRAVVLSIAEA